MNDAQPLIDHLDYGRVLERSDYNAIGCPHTWQERDERARTLQAARSEVLNPNLYRKWLLGQIEKRMVWWYPGTKLLKGPTHLKRPLGEYTVAVLGQYDRMGETGADPHWMLYTTELFDQWYTANNTARPDTTFKLRAEDALEQLDYALNLAHMRALAEEKTHAA